MSSYRPREATRRPDKLLDRAFAAGATLTAAILAVTGLLVTKIANSYAATTKHQASTLTPQDGSVSVGGGYVDPNLSGNSNVGGGTVVAPPQNQPAVGSSSGS